MPELLEKIAIAVAAEVADECPFSHEKGKHDKTNDLTNNSATLGSRLKGGDSQEISVTVRGKTKKMDLGFQAHHLIPGASINGAKPLVSFMAKGSKVKGDVGYTQNDPWNGVWLPALHEFKGWGELGKGGGYEIQFAYAYFAMKATGSQFHMWDSSHKDYNALVRRTLEEIRLKILELRSDCPKCDEGAKQPWDPPYQLNEMLEKLAVRMNGYVTGSQNKWHPPFCTSDFAVLVGAGHTPEKMAGL